MGKLAGEDHEDRIRYAVEAAIRIGVITLLILWVYTIIAPFLGAIVWGGIIAVAGFPAYSWLLAHCGNRRAPAATIFTLIALVLLVTPMVWLTTAVVDWGQHSAAEISDGRLEVPQPPESIRSWPIVGERIYDFWALSSSNLEAALTRAEDQIKALGVWLLKSVATAGLGVLQFFLAILIAGGLLFNSASVSRFVNAFAIRLAPGSGIRFSALAEHTVRGVATGVVGVAGIQCVLAAMGFFAAGVPGAPVIALICLLAGIVQLPLSIPIVPVIIYVWVKEPTLTAALFTAWSVPVMILDNFLKPILMGRGVEAPMLVVFIGAIGGMAASGIVGLFTGAVVLVLAYELFRAWLDTNILPEEVDSDPSP